MSLKHVLVPIAMIAVMAGCKRVKVDKGEIPDQYVAMAKAYMGTYKGTMDGHSGNLVLALKGNKVVASYKDADGKDILNPMCGSKIGNLTAIDSSRDGKTYKIDQAIFDFDPVDCWVSVDGRTLTMNFKKKNGKTQVDISILLRQEWQQQCHMAGGNPKKGIPPQEVCEQVPVSNFTRGTFVK